MAVSVSAMTAFVSVLTVSVSVLTATGGDPSVFNADTMDLVKRVVAAVTVSSFLIVSSSLLSANKSSSSSSEGASLSSLDIFKSRTTMDILVGL